MSKPTTGDFTKTAGWLDWYSGPSKPKFQLPAGAVLAKLTTGPNQGKYTALDPSNTDADGTNVAAALLFAGVDATTADRPAVITARDSEVKAVALGWRTGVTTEQKATALAELAALGIVAR